MILSILIPTYNRPNQLLKLIDYLTADLVENIEILVGNDNPEIIIEFDNLCPQVTIYNNKTNLGECGNINKLICKSSGKYVLVLFDDESLDLILLKDIICKILISDSCDCILVNSYPCSLYSNESLTKLDFRVLSGNGFISSGLYKNRVGFMAIYNKEVLKGIGAIQSFADYPIAVCSEYMLNIKAMQFQRIIIVENPLIRINFDYRSFSVSNNDYRPYLTAFPNFISELKLFLLQVSYDEGDSILFFYNKLMIERVAILIGRSLRANKIIYAYRFFRDDFITVAKKIHAFHSVHSFIIFLFSLLVGLMPEFIRKLKYFFIGLKYEYFNSISSKNKWRIKC